MPELTNSVRLHAVVYGEVQGVGFRYSTRQQARQLRLGGWVRNNPNGTVELVAEGDRADLDAFVAFLRRGPRQARVAGVEVTWQVASHEFEMFIVEP